MPAKTRKTLEELRASAKERFLKFRKNGRTDEEAATEAIATLLVDVASYRDTIRELRDAAPSSSSGTSNDNGAEVRRLENRIRDLERDLEDRDGEISTLRESLPASGALVLTAEQRKTWDTLNGLLEARKIAADKLGEILTERDTLAGKVAESEFAALVDTAGKDIARVAGKPYKPSVLRDIIKSRGLVLENRDVAVPKLDARNKPTTETETVKLPHVRPSGDDKAPWVRLDEYATKHLADYLPALTAQDTSTTKQSSGIVIPAQPGNGTAPSRNPAQTYVDRAYVTPSQRNAARKEASNAQ
jgi:hypothetical protein